MRNKRIRGLLLFCFLICMFLGKSQQVEAKVSALQKRSFTLALSREIAMGNLSADFDTFRYTSKQAEGKECILNAMNKNRLAIMAEQIDFLDASVQQYYSFSRTSSKNIFVATKTLDRKLYISRYHRLAIAMNEVLSSVKKGMSDADKAMAVYQYLTENCRYEASAECHTGYDVLLHHKGVCDGLANAYALCMEQLGIPCAVVTNYKKNHSWNIIKLNNTWYMVDLTIGVGEGEHDGYVVSYDSFLVGKKQFLATHRSYKTADLYGSGNSYGLNLKKEPLATKNYIDASSKLRYGLQDKTCCFYYKGYWYWISNGNRLMRSKLNGKEESIVYTPKNGNFIGWIDSFRSTAYMSMNDSIYTISLSTLSTKKKVSHSDWKKIYTLRKFEHSKEIQGYYWQISFVGHFSFYNASGWMVYRVFDVEGIKYGYEQIPIPNQTVNANQAFIQGSASKLQAGGSMQLALCNVPATDLNDVVWTSSNPDGLEVTNQGLLLAKKNGNYVISARIHDVTLQYTINVYGYTITYKNISANVNGNPIFGEGGKSLTLKDPTKNGYKFQGWYDNETFAGKKIKSISASNKENIILYAKWKKK